MIEVPFLVDTGASWTTLHLTDLLKLGDALGGLMTTPSPIPLRGVGGSTVRPYAMRVGLAFPHVNGGFSRFAMSVAMLPDQAGWGTPSLLGMDVLRHGALTIDATREIVQFDPPTDAAITIDPPW